MADLCGISGGTGGLCQNHGTHTRTRQGLHIIRRVLSKECEELVSRLLLGTFNNDTIAGLDDIPGRMMLFYNHFQVLPAPSMD